MPILSNIAKYPRCEALPDGQAGISPRRCDSLHTSDGGRQARSARHDSSEVEGTGTNSVV